MSVLRVAPRTAVVLVLASAAALAPFTWPLFIPARPDGAARAAVMGHERQGRSGQ